MIKASEIQAPVFTARRPQRRVEEAEGAGTDMACLLSTTTFPTCPHPLTDLSPMRLTLAALCAAALALAPQALGQKKQCLVCKSTDS